MKTLLNISILALYTIGFAQNVATIYSPETGRTWMAKNLGATAIANSIDDEDSFGDLYQWGRSKDGHQLRNSMTSNSQANTSTPNDSLFVLGNSNWMVNQNNDLWQGINGMNNPCPQGFRLPTEEEFEAERETWASNNAAGAFGSPLKLSVGGARSRISGAIGNVGTFVGYRTSTVQGTMVRLMGIALENSFMGSRDRADGNCIRCIKDETLSLTEPNITSKELVRIIDILGRESKVECNKVLFYLYEDGRVEKKYLIK